ncbi:hypothetical protein GCM10010344_74890 [Streptomyces bluensis]|nr:hypothetical protein GCM10010344_74890 [Streptomyces bluensis]
MTTLNDAASGTPAEIPEYDISRPARCPLDPAPAMRARQAEGPLVRIRLWDGTIAWLVTGWDAHRALLSDHRVSVDPFEWRRSVHPPRRSWTT